MLLVAPHAVGDALATGLTGKWTGGLDGHGRGGRRRLREATAGREHYKKSVDP